MALRMCPSKWKDGGAVNQTEGGQEREKLEKTGSLQCPLDTQGEMSSHHLDIDTWRSGQGSGQGIAI